MVQTSKPQRANTFIIEYSPWPGVSRSKIRHVTEEPCTRKRTGRGDSPGLGAPSRLRNIQRGTSPFLAQYSALQMSLVAAVWAGAETPENRPAPTPNPAVFRTARRGRTRSDSFMNASG